MGTHLDGRRLRTLIKSQRYWKLKLAIRYALRRKKLDGITVEIIVGHCTFCALICRGTLSVFHTVYRFIAVSYYEQSVVWDSVREELQAFCGLMCFLVADWALPWNNMVSASDASESGYGISVSYWDRSDVAAVGNIM